MLASVYMSYETRACFNQPVLPNFKAVGKVIDRLVLQSSQELPVPYAGQHVLKKFVKRLPKSIVKNETRWLPKFKAKKTRACMAIICKAKSDLMAEVNHWEMRQKEMIEQKFEFTYILPGALDNDSDASFTEVEQVQKEKPVQDKVKVCISSKIVVISNSKKETENESSYANFLEALPLLLNSAKENQALDSDRSLSYSVDSQESFYSGKSKNCRELLGSMPPLKESLPPCIQVVSCTSLLSRVLKSGTWEENIKYSNLDTTDGQTSLQNKVILSGSLTNQAIEDNRRPSLQLEFMKPLAERSFEQECSNASSGQIEFEEKPKLVKVQNVNPIPSEPNTNFLQVTRSSNTTRINILRSLQKASSPKNNGNPATPRNIRMSPNKGDGHSKTKRPIGTAHKQGQNQQFFSSNMMENSSRLKMVISQKVQQDSKACTV